jgi:hypothetical protein
LSWRDLRRRFNAGIACWTKLEITPPSFSNHSRYGTALVAEEVFPWTASLVLCSSHRVLFGAFIEQGSATHAIVCTGLPNRLRKLAGKAEKSRKLGILHY